MQIFHYHPETGEFLGQSAALPDPLEEGRFLVPAYATDAPPPESGQNKVAVFDGQSWVLKPDFRGTVYWLSHGDKHTITEIGETVPEGAFLEEPAPPAPTPAQIADEARAQRDALLAACDWVAIRANELGEPVPQDWADYRQALRDVPEQVGFPETIDWPTKPED